MADPTNGLTADGDAVEEGDGGIGDSGAGDVKSGEGAPVTTGTPVVTSSVAAIPATVTVPTVATGLSSTDLARLRTLRLEYAGLQKLAEDVPADARGTVEAILGRPEAEDLTLTRDQLLLLEKSLLRFRTLEDLKGKAMLWRLQLHDWGGGRRYKTYLKSLHPDWRGLKGFMTYLKSLCSGAKPEDLDAGTTRQALWSDLDLLLTELYEVDPCNPRVAWRKFQQLRDTLTISITAPTVLVFVGALAFTRHRTEHSQPFPTLILVVLCGSLGGLVSMLRRLQQVRTEGEPVAVYAAFRNTLYSVLLSPVYGGIFAVILYLMFAGGMLQGDIFPKFAPISADEVRLFKTPIAQIPKSGILPTPTATSNPVPTATPAKPAPTPAKAATSGAPAKTPPPKPPAPPAAKPITIARPTPRPTLTSEQVEMNQGIESGFADFYITWLIRRVGPLDTEDLAKLLIWAFIAGFAEAFVPDTLTRMAGAGRRQDNLDS